MTSIALWLLEACAHLPLRLVRFFGAVLGAIIYLVAAERRHITLVNLRLCFPDWSEAQRRRIARAHFRVFTQAILDRGLLWWGSVEKIRKHVHWKGFENFDIAKARGPVIFLAPHFIGLDAGGALTAMSWHAMSMYAKQKNARLDAAVFAGRSRFNDPVLLSRQQGVRTAVRGLRKQVPFYYLPDMDFGPRDAVFVPFFGIPAATVTATARIAAMTGGQILPCVTRMTATGYEVTLYPSWQDFPGDDEVAATAQMNRFIEQRVLEMPEQYLWSHKRFKTRPPGEPSFYGSKR